MNGQPEHFDRDIPLGELLRAVPAAKLEAALTRTIGEAWHIVDADGQTLRAPAANTGVVATVADIALPLRVDFEIIGHLHVPATRREQGERAADWLAMVLASAYRYRMAADLHFETVTADYEQLQRQHAALQESEARYRELAGQLEQRVKAQVEVIERAQRQMYQTEKLASIGSLAAGMAHEINNPIGFIRSNLGSASVYVEKMGETLRLFRSGSTKEADAAWQRHDMDFIFEDFPGLLEESASGADRVARIVANLKAYASIDCAAMAPIDLNEAVRAAVGVLGDQLPEAVKIETDLQPLHPVVGDLSRMNQVLFSLLQNARQALGSGGGRIKVVSRMAGDDIRIAVSDTGCGIGDDILHRIFDPFFTTREVGKGMGLGLAVSRDIVTAHNGTIEVATAVGAGSTFTVSLPAPRGDSTTAGSRKKALFEGMQ